MPLVTQQAVTYGEDTTPGRGARAPELEATPDVLDVVAAALRQNNVVSSLYDRFTQAPLPEPQDDYDPLNDISGYEEHALRFIRSRSPEETQRIKERIRAELTDREVLRRAGGWGLAASVAAGLVDPLTIASMAIPVAPAIAGASRAARITAGVAASAGIEAASEVLLHENQELRTVGESALNIGAGALLTGAFGTIATRIPRNEFEALRKKLDADLAQAPPSSTVGAAAAASTSIEDETIARGGRTLAKTIGRISPLTRLMTSPAKSARTIAQKLAEVPFLLNKNLRGIATSTAVETRVKQLIAQRGHRIIDDLDDAFMRYRQKGGTLKLREFGREVSKAMRRGDEHAIPEVAEVARKTRRMLEKDREELIKLGALPEEVEVVGAKSYFSRVYDQYAIAANRSELERRLTEWFTANPRRDEAGNIIERDAAEVKLAVAETLDRIMGTTRGLADIGGGVKNPAMFKARVLDVPDEVLEPFLVSDFERVMSAYNRAMVPNIELRKTFGSITLERELQEIADEFHVLQTYAKSDVEKEALRQAQASAVADIALLRDRLLGQVGPKGNDSLQLVRLARLARAYNYVRLLGGQTLSSLADYGRIIAQYGLVRTARTTAKFLTSLKANKISRADAQRMGTALEWVLDTRAGTLADIGDELAGSKVEEFAQRATQAFSRITLMAPWNSSLKAITASLEQEAILRLVQGKKISALNRAKLAAHGIGDDMLARIAEQVRQFADDADGMLRARTELWTDREAAQLVEEAVLRSADTLVLSRGVGDLPAFMDREVAKTLLQFKSFGMASVNRLLIPLAQGLAHGDVATANGLAMMLSLGALTYVTKEWSAGREPDLSPERVAAEALNWSGVLGFLPDLYDPLIGAPLNLPRLSRYQDRSASESFLGPTVGTFDEVLNTVGRFTDGSVTDRDIHKLRQLLPLQNLFYLRRAINALEEQVSPSEQQQ